DVVGPYAWRTDAALRLLAGGAIGVWQPLRLWPRGRGGAPSHRHGRTRILEDSHALRRTAGAHADRARRSGVIPHRFSVRVYYEDTDFSGNVYHSAYLHFFERARTEFLRAMGVHHSEL